MRAIDKTTVNTLKRALGRGDVLTSPEDRYVHGFDATAEVRPPALIARPRTVAKLIATVTFLWDERIPLVVRGAGTGFSGGALATAESLTGGGVYGIFGAKRGKRCAKKSGSPSWTSVRSTPS